MSRQTRRIAALLCAALLGAPACAGGGKSSGSKRSVLLADDDSAPAAGGAARKPSVLLSEADDARVGREAAEAVAAEMGILDDPELAAYVSGLGEKLLRGVPGRSSSYRFAVVDRFEPNAFALPGGQIFVSRGLLALTNDEDELANVIGHEITHAARRHAARQQQLAAHQGLSLPWMRAAQMASYGRDMEREADRGGQQLAAAAGYDPRGMARFLASLEKVELLLRGYARGPSFLDTHPGASERASQNAFRASEMRWKRDPSLGDTRRAHLRRLDGLCLGDRPESGLFEGERFVHPDLDFQIRFPAGWRTANTPRAVGATSPRGDGVVFLTADLPPGDLETVARELAEKASEEGPVELIESGPIRLGGRDAWRLELRASGRGGSLVVSNTLFAYRGATWRITGIAPARAAERSRAQALAVARSLRPLTAEQKQAVRITRLRLVEARPGEDLPSLVRRSGSDWETTRIAVANGVQVNHRFEGGELVKIAREEPYHGSAP